MRPPRWLTALLVMAVTITLAQLVLLATPARADWEPRQTWPAGAVFTASDTSVNFAPDDDLHYATYRERNAYWLLNLQNGSRRGIASDTNSYADHGLVSGDGSTVVIQHGAQTNYPHTRNGLTVLRGFDPDTLQGGTETTYDFPDDRDMNSVAISDDGSRFAVGGQDVAVIDTETGVLTQVVPPAGSCTNYSYNLIFDWHQVALSGDGKTLATYVGASCNGGGVNEARVYDITDLAHPVLLWSHAQAGQPYPYPCSPTDHYMPIQLSEDGTKVAVSDLTHPDSQHWLGKVLLHDLSTGADQTFFADQGRVCSISLSSDGSRLAAEVGDPRVTSEGQSSNSWGQSVFVTDTTAQATPVLIAEHTWTASGSSGGYSDYGWGLDGLSGDGTAVLFSMQNLWPSSYHQLYIARDPAAAPLGWPSGAQLTAAQVAQTFVGLQWPGATGSVTSYRVTGAPGGPVDVPAGQTSTTVTGLTPSTAYHFEVRARNGGTSTDPLALDVTTAAPAGPGSAALTATVTGDDTVRLQWDPKSGADGYQVLRATGGGSAAAVAELGPGATQWTDETTDGATSYTYRVAATTGGVAAPHTVNSTVTTTAVAITSTSAAPAQALGYAVPGAPVAVHVVGQPHRAASARLQLQGVAAPSFVALTETSPGKYDGSLTVPPGATHLDSAEVRLADAVGAGTGHTATTTRALGLPVGGALRTHITTSSFHGRAVASSASGGWSVTGGLSSTANIVQLIGIPPAADVKVDYVRDGDGQVRAGDSGLAVAPGQVVDLTASTLTESATARLDGGDDAAGALIDVVEGAVNRQVRLDEHGRASVAGLDSGGQATFTLVSSDQQSWRFGAMGAVNRTLDAGLNDVALPLGARAAASLHGAVVPSISGAPVTGATVAVVQGHGATSQTSSGIVDGTGHYQVGGLLAGLPTTVSVKHRSARTETAVPVDLDPGANAADIPVVVSATYEVQPVLEFESADGGVQPEPLDWRSAVHYRAELTGPSSWVGGSAFGNSGLVDVVGIPGDQVTLCADGVEAGFDKGCASATLPASVDQPVPLTLTLSGASRTTVTYALRTPAGMPDPERTVRLVASRGGEAVVQQLVLGNGQLSLPSGTWDLAFLEPGSAQVLAELPGQALTGATKDLGTVTLATTGPFTGPGNGLVAQQASVSAGGGLDLAATWSPSGAQPAASLTLRLPSSVVVPHPAVAATVNGSPVAASLAAGVLTVPIPAVAAGSSGHATVHLTVKDDAGPGSVVVRAAIGAHPLGVAVASLPAVTLDAPSRVASSSLTVTGRAPAGEAVTVLADGIVLGSATATASGGWRAEVTLPPGARHSMLATTAAASSEPVSVLVDRFAPAFTSVTVEQGALHSYTREPGASYPYVVVLNQPMTVRARMADASRLSSAAVVIDGNRHPMTRDGDTWSATFLADYPRGELWIDYVEAELPTDLPADQLAPTKPSLEVFLNGLPSALSQALGTPSATATPDGQHATITVGPGTVDLTRSDGTGISSTGLPQVAQGVWILQQPSFSVSGGTVQGSLKLLVDTTVARPAGPGRKRIPIAPTEVVEAGFLLGTTFKSANEMADSSGKYDKLNDMLEQATGCSQGSFNNFKDRLDLLLKEAIAVDVGIAAIQVGGLALAPETFGVGTVAMWALGEVLNKALDASLDNLMSDLQDDLNADASCPKPKPKSPGPGGGSGGSGGSGGGGGGGSGPGGPGWGPGARPWWIYDPSGTITDGVDPIAGATVTLTRAESEHGTYTVWDAAAYEQDNDQVTDADGAYGWNVPEGWYVVTASAPGRVPASSEALEVLPPRTGVDLVLAPDHLPTVTSAAASADDVTVTFDGWMRTDFLTANQLTLTDGGGQPVQATVVPVDPRTGTDGDSYAKAVRLTVVPPPADTPVTLAVAAGVQDVLGRPMADGFTKDVTLAGVPVTTPPGPSAACSQAQQAAAGASAALATATTAVTAATKALTKATAKLKKLKKAGASAKRIKAAKKKVKAAKKTAASAQAALGAATTASAAASASASAACR